MNLSLKSRFNVSPQLQNLCANVLTLPSARVNEGWFSEVLDVLYRLDIVAVVDCCVLDMGLLVMVVKVCLAVVVKVTVCHVCCKVGTFIYFFIIHVTCSSDSPVLNHMTQSRACVFKNWYSWMEFFFFFLTIRQITLGSGFSYYLSKDCRSPTGKKFTFDIKFCSNVRNWKWLIADETIFNVTNTDNHSTEIVLVLCSCLLYCFQVILP